MLQVPISPPMSPESFYSKAQGGGFQSSDPNHLPTAPVSLPHTYGPSYTQAYNTEHQDYNPYLRSDGLPGFQVARHGSTSASQHEQLSPGSSLHSILDEDELLDSIEDQDDDDIDESKLTPAQRLSRKRRMKRFRLTHNQTRYMMNEFARQPHPDAAHRERLSQEIPGLSPRQVQVWFQNRRAKLKRLTVEDQERVMRSRELPADVDPTSVLRASTGAPIHPSGSSPFYGTQNRSELANPANVDLSTLGPYDQPYLNSITANATLSYQMRSTQIQARPANINLLAMPTYGLSPNRPQDSPMQPSFPTGSSGVGYDATSIHPSPSPGNVPQGNIDSHLAMNSAGSVYWGGVPPQSQFIERPSSFSVEVSRSNQPPQPSPAPGMQYSNTGDSGVPQPYPNQMMNTNFPQQPQQGHPAYQEARRASACPPQIPSPFTPPPVATTTTTSTAGFPITSSTGVAWNNVYYPPNYQ